MPRNMNHLAAGKVQESPVDFLLRIAAGSDDSDPMEVDTEAPESASPSDPKG